MEKDENFKEMTKNIQCREYASIRLRRNEMWLQNISIYYSCFTAILSLLSICEGSSFLTVPAAMFTVAVAILITFANAQKYGSRANDLTINYNSMKVTQYKYKMASEEKEANEIYYKYIEQLSDSEMHSPVDEYRYYMDVGEKKSRYFWYIYLVFYTIFIVMMFAIPVLYIYFNMGNLITLVTSTYISVV